MYSDTPTMNRGTTLLPAPAALPDTSPQPDGSDRTNEAFASVVKNRKGWKSSKDGEAVWPLEVEEALIEGLQTYVPHNIRIAKSLGRFPLRNRFISDYIYKKTGKRRTPKQVGSRIQQMRDTSAGRELMELLRPDVAVRKFVNSSSPALSHSGLTAGGRLDSTPSGSNPSEPSPSSSVKPMDVVYIDILPPFMGDVPIDFPANPGCFMRPRHISSIDPTVAFQSRSTISAHSVYIVRRQDTVVHTERTALEYAGRLSGEDGDVHHTNDSHLYRSALIPGYWEKICNSAAPTHFTIEQQVRLDLSAASERPLFSSLYKFRLIENPSSSDNQQIDQRQIHNQFVDPTADTRHSEAWDMAAFLGSCLDLNQDITLEDETFFDEYFFSTIQSPPPAFDSPGSQSDDFFAPTPSPRPHSTVLVSSGKSELYGSLSHLPSPSLSPAITTPPNGSAKEIGTYLDIFYSQNELNLNDSIW